MSRFINPDIPFFLNDFPPNGKSTINANGTVYFGEPNQDAKSNPKTPYLDAALTTPSTATQTLTAGGKLQQKLWLKGNYSIIIDDVDGVQIHEDLDWGGSTDLAGRIFLYDNYTDLIAAGSSQYTDGDVVHITDEGIAGSGVIVKSTAHGLTSTEGDIVVIDSDTYWRRDEDRDINLKRFPSITADAVSQSASTLNTLISNLSTSGGGHLIFSKKDSNDYLFSTAIELKSNVHIVVDESVTVRTGNNTRLHLFSAIGTAMSPIENIRFSGGGTIKGWDATGGSGTGDGLHAEYVNHLYIDAGLKWDTFTDVGIHLETNVTNAHLESPHVRNCVECITVRDYCEDVYINDMDVDSGTLTAVQFDAINIEAANAANRLDNIQIRGGVVRNSTQQGVNINNGVDNYLVDGVLVESSVRSGVVARSGTKGSIINCKSFSNAHYGIEVKGTITGLQIAGNQTAGNTLGGLGIATEAINSINDMQIAGDNIFLDTNRIVNLGLVSVNRGVYGDRFSRDFLTADDFIDVIGAPTKVQYGGGSADPNTWNLRNGNTDGVGCYFQIPSEWGSEVSLELDIKIAQVAAAAGDVVLAINTLFIQDGSAVTSAGASHTKTFTLSGGLDQTTSLTLSNSETSDVLKSTSENRILRIRIARVGGDAADTAATDIRILGVTIKREAGY